MRLTGFYLTDEQIKERVECFRYIRDEKKNPIGIVVLDKHGRIGWSLYNDVAERRAAEENGCIQEMATTDKGLLIALNRASDVADPETDIRTRIAQAHEYRIVTRLLATHIVIKEMIKLRYIWKSVPKE